MRAEIKKAVVVLPSGDAAGAEQALALLQHTVFSGFAGAGRGS